MFMVYFFPIFEGWFLEGSSDSRGSNGGTDVQGGEALLAQIRVGRLHAHVHSGNRYIFGLSNYYLRVKQDQFRRVSRLLLSS